MQLIKIDLTIKTISKPRYIKYLFTNKTNNNLFYLDKNSIEPTPRPIPMTLVVVIGSL